MTENVLFCRSFLFLRNHHSTYFCPSLIYFIFGRICREKVFEMHGVWDLRFSIGVGDYRDGVRPLWGEGGRLPWVAPFRSLVGGEDADTWLSHRRRRNLGQRDGGAQAEGQDQKDSAHFKAISVEASMPSAQAPGQNPVP
jgi:hypothetical protein